MHLIAGTRAIAALALILGAGCDEQPIRAEEAPRGARFANDSAVAAAAAAVAAGRAWHATLLLAPVLADSARRSPEAELIAARAAATWGGWKRVRDVLEKSAWLDRAYAGEGHELLARAALGERRDSAAARHAERAVDQGRPGAVRGIRLVLLARALERIDAGDSSTALYRAAIEPLPEIADWLRLRAAGVTADSASRATLYEDIELPPARARVVWTEAYALDRTGRRLDAARIYDSLGSPIDAIRLRLLVADSLGDSTMMARTRDQLFDLVRSRPASSDAREAVAMIDARFGPLSVDEDLAVARSAVRTGPSDRALRAYARVIGAAAGTPGDRFDYATLLSRVGRDADAARQFARITAPASLASSAAYQHARSLLRAGDGAGARLALAQVIARYPNSDAAASAHYLLGDLATDAGDDATARRHFLTLARSFPAHRLASAGRLRAGIAAFVSGHHAVAARELDSLIQRHPSGDDAAAARYWAGRAWAAARNEARARDRWREALRRDSLSYYAQLAARRLDTTSWTPTPVPHDTAADADIFEALSRAERLEQAGMNLEARFEYEALAASAHQSVERMLDLAEAFRARGYGSRAIQLATRAIARGAPRDARTYRLLYPVVFENVLLEHARRRTLDPALVAALIRQESHFEPRATSRADARGLMQLLPSTGRSLARRLGFPLWSDELLYEPEANVQLGTAHLAAALAEYGDTARALAAYNAGGSRVVRWAAKAGADDPEVFIERIPYVETRDYVRVIQRTRAWYRSLYGW